MKPFAFQPFQLQNTTYFYQRVNGLLLLGFDIGSHDARREVYLGNDGRILWRQQSVYRYTNFLASQGVPVAS